MRFTADPGARALLRGAGRRCCRPAAPSGPRRSRIVQIEDRTETRRAEQLRSDFIANASHELRTPLASIIGYIETLQHHARDDPEARERFLGDHGARGGADAAARRRPDVAQPHRDERARPAGRGVVARTGSPPRAPRRCCRWRAQQGVTLEIDLPPEGAPVLGDRDQLAQVFTNLIDNAMKYGGAGATVRVRAAAPSKAHPNRHGVDGRRRRPGHPARASPPADRALLPGQRQPRAATRAAPGSASPSSSTS